MRGNYVCLQVFKYNCLPQTCNSINFGGINYLSKQNENSESSFCVAVTISCTPQDGFQTFKDGELSTEYSCHTHALITQESPRISSLAELSSICQYTGRALFISLLGRRYTELHEITKTTPNRETCKLKQVDGNFLLRSIYKLMQLCFALKFSKMYRAALKKRQADQLQGIQSDKEKPRS